MTYVNARAVASLALAMSVYATAARAQAIVSGNISYFATVDTLSSPRVTTLNLGQSSSTGLVSQAPVTFQTVEGGTAQVTFSGSSGVYSGNVSGVAAVPQLGGRPIGNFMAAEPNGAVTVSYSQSQAYFGLNWGSVDRYNSLTFYNNGAQVASLSGTQVLANSSGFYGSTSSNVSINFTNGTTFDQVVARSTSPAFEFGIIQSSRTNVPVPAPLPLGSTPIGAIGALLLYLRARSFKIQRAKF